MFHIIFEIKLRCNRDGPRQFEAVFQLFFPQRHVHPTCTPAPVFTLFPVYSLSHCTPIPADLDIAYSQVPPSSNIFLQ